MGKSYRTQSANILNDADRFETQLNWMLFTQEQDARIWAPQVEGEWYPGDFLRPYPKARNIWGFNGLEQEFRGNCPRRMAEIVNDLANFREENRGLRCWDCEVDWDDFQPCWVCGVYSSRLGPSLPPKQIYRHNPVPRDVVGQVLDVGEMSDGSLMVAMRVNNRIFIDHIQRSRRSAEILAEAFNQATSYIETQFRLAFREFLFGTDTSEYVVEPDMSVFRGPRCDFSIVDETDEFLYTPWDDRRFAPLYPRTMRLLRFLDTRTRSELPTPLPVIHHRNVILESYLATENRNQFNIPVTERRREREVNRWTANQRRTRNSRRDRRRRE